MVTLRLEHTLRLVPRLTLCLPAPRALPLRALCAAPSTASNTDTSAERLAAYVGATGSSVTVALAVNRYAKRLTARMGPGALAPILLGRMAPFAAVAAADFLNLFAMRFSEYQKGVNVWAVPGHDRLDDEPLNGTSTSGGGDGKPELLGRSRVAGFFAVSACTTGRVLAACPVLTVPPLVLTFAERRYPAFFAARPWVRVPLTLGLLGLMIQVAVPVTFGLFRQSASADVNWLEPRFRGLRDRTGAEIRRVVYNKGL